MFHRGQSRITTVLLGWGAISVVGIGSFIFAKKTIDKRRLALIKSKAADRRRPKENLEPSS